MVSSDITHYTLTSCTSHKTQISCDVQLVSVYVDDAIIGETRVVKVWGSWANGFFLIDVTATSGHVTGSDVTGCDVAVTSRGGYLNFKWLDWVGI